MQPAEGEFVISCDSLKLKGRFYEPTGGRGKSPLLLLCHGIPAASPAKAKENSGHLQAAEDGGYEALARRCAEAGFAVFHFNFRGTGESEGNLDLGGWRRDLGAVLDFLEEEKGESKFLLWGFSAGAAVACCVAAGDLRVVGLVMAASPAEFTSIFSPEGLHALLELMRQRGVIRDPSFPPDPFHWLQQFHAASPLLYIGAIAPRPLLIIHGKEDELIPCNHAYQLYRKADSSSARLIIQPDAGHQMRRHPPTVEQCLKWLHKVVEPGEDIP